MVFCQQARKKPGAHGRRRISDRPVLTDLEHPGPTLDPHAFSVGSRPNDQHLVRLTISFKLAKTTIRIAHKLVGRKWLRGKNSNRGPAGYGNVGEKIT